MDRKTKRIACPACPPKVPLGRRRKLDPELVRRLSDLFGILNSGTRIRLLHLVAREGELTVLEIARRLGMKVAAVSNQLRLMALQGILGSRQEGARVYYYLVDPCVPEILEKGACLAVEAQKRVAVR